MQTPHYLHNLIYLSTVINRHETIAHNKFFISGLAESAVG